MLLSLWALFHGCQPHSAAYRYMINDDEYGQYAQPVNKCEMQERWTTLAYKVKAYLHLTAPRCLCIILHMYEPCLSIILHSSN